MDNKNLQQKSEYQIKSEEPKPSVIETPKPTEDPIPQIAEEPNVVEEPKPSVAVILIPFLRERLPQIFDYTDFSNNPKQNIRIYRDFAQKATKALLAETERFLVEQGVK
jgi:hypothetical protein